MSPSPKKFNYTKWSFMIGLPVAIVGAIAAVVAVPDIGCKVGLRSLECAVAKQSIDLITQTEIGESLAGVKIQFIAQGAPEIQFTDSNGYAKVEIPSKGDVRVNLSKSGYPVQDFIINLENTQSTVRVIRFSRTGQPDVQVVADSTPPPPLPPPVEVPPESQVLCRYKNIEPIRVDIKLDRSVYTELDIIKVEYAIDGTPEGAKQSITVVEASKPEDAFGQWERISQNGSVSFKSQRPGDYKIRLFINTGSGNVPVGDCSITVKKVE